MSIIEEFIDISGLSILEIVELDLSMHEVYESFTHVAVMNIKLITTMERLEIVKQNLTDVKFEVLDVTECACLVEGSGEMFMKNEVCKNVEGLSCTKEVITTIYKSDKTMDKTVVKRDLFNGALTEVLRATINEHRILHTDIASVDASTSDVTVMTTGGDKLHVNVKSTTQLLMEGVELVFIWDTRDVINYKAGMESKLTDVVPYLMKPLIEEFDMSAVVIAEEMDKLRVSSTTRRTTSSPTKSVTYRDGWHVPDAPHYSEKVVHYTDRNQCRVLTHIDTVDSQPHAVMSMIMACLMSKYMNCTGFDARYERPCRVDETSPRRNNVDGAMIMKIARNMRQDATSVSLDSENGKTVVTIRSSDGARSQFRYPVEVLDATSTFIDKMSLYHSRGSRSLNIIDCNDIFDPIRQHMHVPQYPNAVVYITLVGYASFYFFCYKISFSGAGNIYYVRCSV